MQFLFITLIEAFLLLTPVQKEGLTRNEQALVQWRQPRYERQIEVNSEILEEKKKDPVDPIALGLRYAEIEAIRREIAEREAAVLTANVQLLTEAQRLRLRTLEEARRLRSTVDEAECARLLTSADRTTCFAVFSDPNNPLITIPANRLPENRLPLPTVSPTSIQDFLDLSPDQRRTYQVNIDEFNQWSNLQQRIIGRWQLAACLALAASPLEPAAIGSPFSSIAVTERQIDGRRAALIQANHALLTPVQRARLQLLVEARALTGPIQEAEGGGFLQPLEAERGGFLQPFNGISTSRFRWFDTTAFNVLDPCRP